MDFILGQPDAAAISEIDDRLGQIADPSEKICAKAALKALVTAEPYATVGTLKQWAPTVSRFGFRSNDSHC
jgi:hypothetical protein